MRGVSNAVVLAVIALVAILGIGGMAVYTLTAVAPRVPVAYDGEFDDGFLATKAWFINSVSENTNCNITSDVLGGSDYSSCIYRSLQPTIGDTAGENTTTLYWSMVFDLDGAVEKMDIDAALQTTGTCNAKDDMNIKKAQIWTYEDTPRLVQDLYIDDQDEIDDSTGALAGDEYVLYIELQTLNVDPTCAAGDDLLKVDLDIKTDGDTDAARFLMESG